MKSFISIIQVLIFFSFCSEINLSAQVIKGSSDVYSFNITPDVVKPPVLSVDRNTTKFMDANKTNILDPFEVAEIIFKINNSGEGQTRELKFTVTEKNNISGLIFEKSHFIGAIMGKSSKMASISLSTNELIVDGMARFSIEFEEMNGFVPKPIEIAINTKRFLVPRVNLVDFKLNSEQIVKGSPFEILLLIQNIGEGQAQNVNIEIDNPENTFFLSGEKEHFIGEMGPGDTILLKCFLIASSKYNEPEIPISVNVSEKFQKYGEKHNIKLPINQDILTENIVISAGEKTNNYNRSSVQLAKLGVDIENNIPESNIVKKNIYVLAIGNEDYTTYQSELTAESNVNFAISDATIFAEYCEKTLGIPKGNITLITNAITSQMKREIIRLTDKSKYLGNEIELIFYYSGHGFPDESKESYIMPVDVSGTDVIQGIKLSQLYSDLIVNPCKKVIVIIDACFSGGGRNLGLLTAKAVRIAPKEVTLNGSLVVFTASSEDEESFFYKEKQHGLFTYFFLKKIQETKGNVTFGEIHDYLQKMVPFIASDIYYKTQTPQTLYGKEIANTWRKWKF